MNDVEPASRDAPPPGQHAHRAWSIPVLIFTSVCITAWIGILLSRETGFVAAIWLANGVLATALIRMPRPHWPLVLAAGAAGILAANLLTDTGILLSVGLMICNVAEALLFAAILLSFDKRADLSRPATMAGLCLAAFGPPVAVSGLAAAGLLSTLVGTSFFDTLAVWYPADVLGLLIVVPLLLSLRRRDIARLAAARHWLAALAMLGVVGLTATLVFVQDNLPLLFLVFLPLAFTTFRLGLGGGALAVALVGGIALAGTVHGLGPIALMEADARDGIFLLQVFLAAASLSVLPVASVFAEQRRLTAALRTAKTRAETSEAAHRTASALLASTLEHMDQGLIMGDSEGRLQVYNEKVLDMLGLPEELMAGKPHASEVLAFQQARGDFDAMPGEDRVKLQPYNGLDPISSYERELPDGRILEMRTRLIPTGGMVRTYTDVSETRRAERRLAEREALLTIVTENAGDMISRTGPDGRRLYVSPAVEALLGYSVAEALEQVQRDLVHPDDLSVYDRMVESVIDDGAAASSSRYRCRNKAGDWVWLETRIKRVADRATGRAIEYVAVSRDVTEQQEQAEALRCATEAAEASAELAMVQQAAAVAASNAKTDFLAGMSHELRTPLNAILGFSQLLQLNAAGHLTQNDLQYCANIIKGGHHLLNLVNQLLDLAGIESGRMHMSIEAVPVAEAVSQAVETMLPVAQKNGVVLHPPHMPDGLLVRGDRLRMQQVLLNLLSNAIKYNRTDGSVRVEAGPAEDGGIVVSIHDTGRGIAQEHHNSLFQPFERFGAEFSAIEGTGIGLSLCKKLIVAMDGDIGFDSRPGEGSRFWFRLPVAEGLPVAADAATDPPAIVDPDPLDCTVLYVEDNPINLDLMERLVEMLPATRLRSAPSGSIGLDMARELHPDVIILDLHLPGLNGYEVLKALKSDPGTWQIPVIALTASAMANDAKRGIEAGFFRYLTKPLDVKKLLRCLEDAINLPDEVADTVSRRDPDGDAALRTGS